MHKNFLFLEKNFSDVCPPFIKKIFFFIGRVNWTRAGITWGARLSYFGQKIGKNSDFSKKTAKNNIECVSGNILILL
jgi:hypothetical protein